MLQNYANWRVDFKVENIERTFELQELSKVLECFNFAYHGVDKEGCPIHIECSGMITSALWRVTTVERMHRYMVMHHEDQMNFRFPACCETSGKRIETQIIINDLAGITMSTADRNVYSLLKMTSQAGADYYPDILGTYFIINCPGFFTFIWAILKGWVDEKTRAKFNIIGADYKGELLKKINADQLPTIYGGTCSCPGGCMNSDKGPWLDYLPVYPVGCVPKALLMKAM